MYELREQGREVKSRIRLYKEADDPESARRLREGNLDLLRALPRVEDAARRYKDLRDDDDMGPARAAALQGIMGTGDIQ